MAKNAPMRITEFGDGYKVTIKLLSAKKYGYYAMLGFAILMLLGTIIGGFMNAEPINWRMMILSGGIAAGMLGFFSYKLSAACYIMITPDYLFIRDRFNNSNKLSIPVTAMGAVGIKLKFLPSKDKDNIPDQLGVFLYMEHKIVGKSKYIYQQAYPAGFESLEIFIGFLETVAQRMSKFYELEYRATAVDSRWLAYRERITLPVNDKPWRIK